MTSRAAVGLLRCTPLAAGRVRQVAVPATARALSTLPRVDYEDAFIVEADAAGDRTSDQWARAVLEGAPAVTRAGLRVGWSALGLRLGPTPSPDESVLGWELRRSSRDVALLASTSPLGLAAEVLFTRQPHGVLFATFVHHQSSLSRAVWLGVAPIHRRAVRCVLEQAAVGTAT
jgi:hypothetical protein